MQQVPLAEIKRCLAQKGAQHEATFGRGCENGMPIRIIVTDGTTADCTQGCKLIENIEAGGLLADRGYDSNDIINKAISQNMKVVIPPKRNRKIQRIYDKDRYKFRHLVENAFLYMKQWRGVNTRYCKHINSFIAFIQIRCLVLWGNLI